MSLSACPDCGGNLGKNALKCRCGWMSGSAQVASSGGIPCAADPGCKYFGRLWTRNLEHHQRICVDHYYIAIQLDGSLAGEPVIPPVPLMRGVVAKPVAGRD